MPSAQSASIYNLVNQTVNPDELYDRLQGYSDESYNQNVDGPVRTTAENVIREDHIVGCVWKYEAPIKIESWDGDDSWMPRTYVQNLRFSDNIYDGGFVLMGKSAKRGTAVSRVLDFLDIRPDQYNEVTLSSAAIERIVEADAQNPTAIAVEDVDENTSGASASGDVNESSYAQDIDEEGNKTWLQYRSREYGFTVGMGTSSVAFYGNGWGDKDMMDYIESFILPNIH